MAPDRAQWIEWACRDGLESLEGFAMRMIDAEPTIIRDLKEEGDVMAEKSAPGVTVVAVRHPTLGKLVIVEGPQGSGVVVEVDQ